MRNTLYWFVLTLVCVGAGSAIYLKYQDTRPCVHPITYAVGTVDPRFDITDATLVTEMKAATNIWNTAEGRTIFTYDPTSALKINLIYDARQASAKLGIEITKKQAEEDAARAALDTAQAQYAAQEAAYNQKVSMINASGGATRSEAAILMSERDALRNLADSINVKVAAFNTSIAALNAAIHEYNQAAGQTFKEGEYVRDAAGERINIFEFVGTTQLERVLAHEFGHALGLGHNSDPKSIMYAQNESGNLVPTASDLAALKAVCGS